MSRDQRPKGGGHSSGAVRSGAAPVPSAAAEDRPKGPGLWLWLAVGLLAGAGAMAALLWLQ